MGFFKGVRDLQSLTQDHGGMPSIRGSFSDIGKMADDRGAKEVLKKGVPAKGFVKGFPEPVQGDRFAMHIVIEVHPADGSPPYDVDYLYATARMTAPIVAGMEVPIKVMPDDPHRIAVQWDVQKGSIAAQGGDMAAVQNAMGNAYAGAADQAMREAMDAQKKKDPSTKLNQLKQMHDAGLIDDAEFAAKKKDILEAM
jgi:Short C-terminal domain